MECKMCGKEQEQEFCQKCTDDFRKQSCLTLLHPPSQEVMNLYPGGPKDFMDIAVASKVEKWFG